MSLRRIFRHSRVLLVAAVVVAAASMFVLGPTTASTAASRATPPPPIRHVWIIQLENEGYPQTFGDPSADPYLATTLRSEGALLKNYYAIGHNSLDNYIAEVTGQAPDLQTQVDCPVWQPFEPTNDFVPPYHQLKGSGCVYPASVETIGNQLSAAHLTWKAYMQDMGNDPKRDHTTQTSEGPACGHPAVGKPDGTEVAVPSDQYATRHEGFMYFESVIDDSSYCDAHIVSFQPLLSNLSSVSTTPNYSWLTPNLCMDGHDSPCVDGDPGGLREINAFLQIWVPTIMASPAYKANGLIMITFDEGTTDGACCGETAGHSPSHPNTTEPGLGGPGGGRVGAILLSPSSSPEPSARSTTTTTRCSRASRTYSGCPTWATPRCRR